MAHVADFCIDRFEAHLVLVDEVGANGVHPSNRPVGRAKVRAASARGVLPQAYVSYEDARAACDRAGKRLCRRAEWRRACRGSVDTKYPYGDRRRRDHCNDAGVEPLAALHGRTSEATWGFDVMNDPALHLVPGSVARTGRFTRCASEEGVFDLVGNLHEWIDDPEGTLVGGFFLDTESLGRGCDYEAIGHDARYRDYSTSFRCCADTRSSPRPSPAR
jgi:sulfatase modifying factor 1